MCLADTRLFLPGLNLAYTDRASMAASIEVRVPFVDPRGGRAAFSIPGSDKIQRRQGKVALKQAAESLAAARDRAPAEGLVRRAAARLGPQRPAASSSTTCWSAASWSSSGMIRGEPLLRLIADEQAGREDTPSRSGSC